MISLSVCFVNLCTALKHHRDSRDRFELVQNADDNCYQVDEPELCLSLHQTGAEQCCVGKSRQGISRYFKIFQGYFYDFDDFDDFDARG